MSAPLIELYSSLRSDSSIEFERFNFSVSLEPEDLVSMSVSNPDPRVIDVLPVTFCPDLLSLTQAETGGSMG